MRENEREAILMSSFAKDDDSPLPKELMEARSGSDRSLSGECRLKRGPMHMGCMARTDESGSTSRCGKNLLLPPGDVEAWRSAFRRFSTQPSLLQNRRDNARVHAQEFDAKPIALGFEDFISELAAKP
jgi:hypothetical protein